MSWPNIESSIERITETGCWIWMGALSAKGYARTSINGAKKSVHRSTYELLIGAIPAGLQLDHLCRIRCCCNPAHLEPVTGKENVRRGCLAEVQRERLLSKTHCVNGHPYNDVNLYIRRDGRRQCRTCNVEKQRMRRAVSKGTANGMA